MLYSRLVVECLVESPSIYDSACGSATSFQSLHIVLKRLRDGSFRPYYGHAVVMQQLQLLRLLSENAILTPATRGCGRTSILWWLVLCQVHACQIYDDSWWSVFHRAMYIIRSCQQNENRSYLDDDLPVCRDNLVDRSATICPPMSREYAEVGQNVQCVQLCTAMPNHSGFTVTAHLELIILLTVGLSRGLGSELSPYFSE